ncbi:polymer-forming cytoskeletal protein [Membranicola marinus]|uniref:Polymer-forming cytoskeletal protein n=1 Tax=Membranihabitans marinus TaxID=1227546 RepID=A0A953LCY6_9BACT|nr:polymer-forming cytoskeletal protein [Membranihabitans marinus]MBY5958274.1 polymer-forming cytoskeletal protein [Membranihabitans marinus]
MFGKKNSENQRKDNGTNRKMPGGGDGHNMIVSTTKLTGNVTSKNDFRIDGEFEGSLDCEAKVIIGEGGRYEGEVKCANAVIEGTFKGQLSVSEVLYVKETAVIHGEVVTGKLVVQSGSIFEVQCKMTGQDNPNIKIEEEVMAKNNTSKSSKKGR